MSSIAQAPALANPAALPAPVRAALSFLVRVAPEHPVTPLQIADTFALASPAAPTSRSEIRRRLTAQAVDLWDTNAPPGGADPLAGLDLVPLARRPPLYTLELRQ